MHAPPPYFPSGEAFDAAAYSHPPYEPHYPARPSLHLTPEQKRINTLFVSGLPDDVLPREIHNLFRRRHGFDHCQLEYTGRGNEVVAFATFFTHQSAMATLGTLNGMVFDPQIGATLHIELARSNSRTKHSRGVGYVVIDKRAKATEGDHKTFSNEGGRSDDKASRDQDTSGEKGTFIADNSGETAVNPADSNVASKLKHEKHPAVDIPPCSTLFLANLGPQCTEEELNDALSKHPGFLALKMQRRGGMPVAFADFEDVKSSTDAMNGLQGELLGSSDRGGLHAEYPFPRICFALVFCLVVGVVFLQNDIYML